MLQCFVCSPIPKVSEKKWATGQSFTQKEITSYRIGTLVCEAAIFDSMSARAYLMNGSMNSKD